METTGLVVTQQDAGGLPQTVGDAQQGPHETPWLEADVLYLSLEQCFDGDASDEIEPDDVKGLQDQQQTIKQPPGPIGADDLPALEQDAGNNARATRSLASWSK